MQMQRLENSQWPGSGSALFSTVLVGTVQLGLADRHMLLKCGHLTLWEQQPPHSSCITRQVCSPVRCRLQLYQHLQQAMERRIRHHVTLSLWPPPSSTRPQPPALLSTA